MRNAERYCSHGRYSVLDCKVCSPDASAKHTPTPWIHSVGNGEYFVHSKFAPTEAIGRNFSEADAEFIIRAVNPHEALLAFARKHHEVCEECEGTGKIYNNADPTSGQWVPCPYAEAIAQAEKVRP